MVKILKIAPNKNIPVNNGYGYLYNFFTCVNAKLITSSDDWIVPDYAEYIGGYPFQVLLNYIGGVWTADGGHLKEAGYTYWSFPNSGADNSAKFNGRGGGFRGVDGVFYSFGASAYFWTSFANTATDGVYASLSASNTWFFCPTDGTMPYTDMNRGHSIRLVKTSTILTNGQTGAYIGNDGQVYQTICIGTQEWLAYNLQETKYRDGSLIPNLTDNDDWINDADGAYCINENNPIYVSDLTPHLKIAKLVDGRILKTI